MSCTGKSDPVMLLYCERIVLLRVSVLLVCDVLGDGFIFLLLNSGLVGLCESVELRYATPAHLVAAAHALLDEVDALPRSA